MKTILKKRLTLKSFYENIIKNKLPNRENLFSQINADFKEILSNTPIDKNFKALDLGYGYGNYSLALAKKGFEVLAVDHVSSTFFRSRIKNTKISNKIQIIKKDLNLFIPRGKFNFVVAKDIFHFLTKRKVRFFLNKLIKLTEKNGWHYIVIFTDIERKSEDGIKIVIENEANFTSDYLLDILNKLYKNWEVEIIIEDYKERDRSGVKGKFYFLANKITIIAKNNNPKTI